MTTVHQNFDPLEHVSFENILTNSAELRELFICKLVILQGKGQCGEKQLTRTTQFLKIHPF